MAEPRLCVITVTYYTDESDLRFKLALQLCELASKLQISTIIVDGSPYDDIRKQLVTAGGGHVRVIEQNNARYPGKGGALRQAAMEAERMLSAQNGDTSGGSDENNSPPPCAICFTEPEKVDLMNHVNAIVAPILGGTADVVVPSRDEDIFRATYPIEQYHSESFANYHLHSLARKIPGFDSSAEDKRKGLDWLFGPFAFRADLADSWLSYEGKSWDAQMVPYIRGVRRDGWKIRTVKVPFRHPKNMKMEEEGDPKWTNKRLLQLNLLFDLLGKELSVAIPGGNFRSSWM